MNLQQLTPDQINKLEIELIAALKNCSTPEALETFRLTHLSRQGLLTNLFEQLKTCSTQQKKDLGPALNGLKNNLQQAFLNQENSIQANIILQALKQDENFDVTIAPIAAKGSLHPYTHIIEKIEDIFSSMGYQVVDGPELETDFFNFTGLNIPHNHPARDESDTFWIDDQHLLRTQTSTVQLRTMMNQKPPIAMIAHGRTMRNEATDASHDFMFMQIEGMFIGKNISIADLLGTLETFLTQFFEKNIKLRVRPGYFPFVEPGLEIDASCPFCTTGCSTCKKSGWIELLGAGLIHPNVLKSGNIDPEEFNGFAFGCGLTRLVMLKYTIPDIRLLHSSNLKFLQQF